MKRIISIILAAVVVLSMGLILGACGKKGPKTDDDNASGKAILTATEVWEKKGDPSVKIAFGKDGTGKMTANNGKVWHEMIWLYDDSDISMLLARMVIGSREEDVEWMVEFDKADGELELMDLVTEEETTYVKAGSQSIKAKAHDKDARLDGIWYSSYFDPGNLVEVANAYSLQTDDALLSGYGRFDIPSKTVDVRAIYIDWYTEGNKLNVILTSGVTYEFTYKLNGEKLELYRGGELIRSLEKVIDGKIDGEN